MILNIHQNIKEKLEYFQYIHKIPNIIFHGPTGSGKRTIVNEFIHKIYENDREKIKSFVMYVNCSHGKGIKFIREELKFFAKTHINSNGGNVFKSIILLNDCVVFEILILKAFLIQENLKDILAL
jgi:DNA polymerase III delta prime subunit